MSQVLDLLFSLAFFLMMICAAITAGSVRLLRAEGASFQEALKRITTTRWFWIQTICSVLSLIELTLARLQEYSLFVSILQSFAVVLVVTAVLALASFWLVGLWLKEKKGK
jgi:SNF family Na+-dependent transporter